MRTRRLPAWRQPLEIPVAVPAVGRVVGDAYRTAVELDVRELAVALRAPQRFVPENGALLIAEILGNRGHRTKTVPVGFEHRPRGFPGRDFEVGSVEGGAGVRLQLEKYGLPVVGGRRRRRRAWRFVRFAYGRQHQVVVAAGSCLIARRNLYRSRLVCGNRSCCGAGAPRPRGGRIRPCKRISHLI